MTKEQEEVIELAENFTKMDFSNPMGWTGYYDTELKELSQAIETVLNILKEKIAEVEIHTGLEHFYKKEDLDKLELLREANAKIKEKHKEIEKKDKQIDLMAEQLAGLTLWNNEKEEPLILTDKEEVKQYFERKATNNG